MKISVIVPSNDKRRMNSFIRRFDKMKTFKNKVTLVIVCNGGLKSSDLIVKPYIHTVDSNECNDTDKAIIPFAKLRGLGMKSVKADWFLFLDDDHEFDDNANKNLLHSIEFLKTHKDCGVLQLEKDNKEKIGFYIKKNAHIWTSRGCFIKNIDFDYDKFDKLVGACEELLFAYTVLYEGFIPYCIWNSGISRNSPVENSKLGKRHKEFNDISYLEKTLDDNIIGYIRELYGDKDWQFYGKLSNLTYPNDLRQRIKSRLSNIII